MSRKGQLLRGEKWYNLYRDAEGNLLPVIANDKQKMANVNLFLEARAKEKEEAKDYPKENINLPPEERKPKSKEKK